MKAHDLINKYSIEGAATAAATAHAATDDDAESEEVEITPTTYYFLLMHTVRLVTDMVPPEHVNQEACNKAYSIQWRFMLQEMYCYNKKLSLNKYSVLRKEIVGSLLKDHEAFMHLAIAAPVSVPKSDAPLSLTTVTTDGNAPPTDTSGEKETINYEGILQTCQAAVNATALSDDEVRELLKYLMNNPANKALRFHKACVSIAEAFVDAAGPNNEREIIELFANAVDMVFNEIPDKYIQHIEANVALERLRAKMGEREAVLSETLQKYFSTFQQAASFLSRRAMYVWKAVSEIVIGEDRVTKIDYNSVFFYLRPCEKAICALDHTIRDKTVWQWFWTKLIDDCDVALIGEISKEVAIRVVGDLDAWLKDPHRKLEIVRRPEPHPSPTSEHNKVEKHDATKDITEKAEEEELEDTDESFKEEEFKQKNCFIVGISQFQQAWAHQSQLPRDKFVVLVQFMQQAEGFIKSLTYSVTDDVTDLNLRLPRYYGSAGSINKDKFDKTAKPLELLAPNRDIDIVAGGEVTIIKTRRSIKIGQLFDLDIYVDGSLALDQRFLYTAWLVPPVKEAAKATMKWAVEEHELESVEPVQEGEPSDMPQNFSLQIPILRRKKTLDDAQLDAYGNITLTRPMTDMETRVLAELNGRGKDKDNAFKSMSLKPGVIVDKIRDMFEELPDNYYHDGDDQAKPKATAEEKKAQRENEAKKKLTDCIYRGLIQFEPKPVI